MMTDYPFLALKKVWKVARRDLQKWTITISSGLFLFVVLFFYKGYDIQQGLSISGHSLLFRSITFGLVTSFSFGFHEFCLKSKLKLSALKSQFLWVFWELFAGLNLTFLLFNYFWSWTELLWKAYFLLCFEYSLVMIIPLSFSFLLKTRPLTKISLFEDMLLFVSENGKQQVKLKPECFLYMKSEGNYINIFYISSGEIKSKLIRTTLKTIEKKYPKHANLLRCHRSYLVNPQNINQVIVRPRQVILDLGPTTQIPVSQKYQTPFVSAVS